MKNVFYELLRTNFYCERMSNSRADEMAGHFGEPFVHVNFS